MRENELPRKINFIELINGFYDLNIPNQLDPASSFLFITLLRKFNSTKNKSNGEYFPESLPIYNSELCHLTGMETRTLHNARERLMKFRLIDSDETTWIAQYEQRGTKESGIYRINYELIRLFDYGKFGNKYFHNNADDYGKFGNVKCAVVSEIESKSAKSAAKVSTMNDQETGVKPAPNNTEIENGKFLAFKLNETKHNITLSPGTIPVPGTEQLSEKNDDDIVAYAEEVVEKRLEINTQVKSIQKALRDKFSLKEWDKIPSDQFLLDLIRLHKSNGGHEYIMNKIDQLPVPLEVFQIGDKLRSYCSHPEISKNGGNGKKSKPDIDPVKAKIEKEKKQLGEELVQCVDKNEFWKLLRKAVEISSIPNPVEYLFIAYKPERIKLDAKEDFEWFIEYCKGVEK